MCRGSHVCAELAAKIAEARSLAMHEPGDAEEWAVELARSAARVIRHVQSSDKPEAAP